jgi:hypothetical protein
MDPISNFSTTRYRRFYNASWKDETSLYEHSTKTLFFTSSESETDGLTDARAHRSPAGGIASAVSPPHDTALPLFHHDTARALFYQCMFEKDPKCLFLRVFYSHQNRRNLIVRNNPYVEIKDIVLPTNLLPTTIVTVCRYQV